jgi:hypothetical protein
MRIKNKIRKNVIKYKAKFNSKGPAAPGSVQKAKKATPKRKAAAAKMKVSRGGSGSTTSTELKQLALSTKGKVKSTARNASGAARSAGGAMTNWSAKKKAAMQKLWERNRKK